MQFEPPLISGRLVRRYKRFLADVVLDDGREVTAHCANPGAMTGLNAEGAQVWLQAATNPARKLKFSWLLVDVGGGHFAGIDTSLPNKLVRSALAARAIPELAPYDEVLPEQKYGESSRIDFLLRRSGAPDTYVEVKNAHLSRTAGLAEFPDSVTARGEKHLRELARIKAQGARAVMFYLVQRTDCSGFSLASDIDPAYSASFAAARAAGVEVLVYDTAITTGGIEIRRRVPFTGADS